MLYDFGDNKGLVEARIHRNGGGVVAATSRVEDTVFLDRTSVVFGHACVKDRVRIVGHCRISGDNLPGNVSTLVEDDAFISGNVVLEGHVLMRDHSQARNFAKLSGSVAMMHHAKVADRVTIVGQVQMCDYSYAHEDVTVIAEYDLITLNARDLLSGNSILSSLKEVNSFLGKVTRKRRGPKRQIAVESAETNETNETNETTEIDDVDLEKQKQLCNVPAGASSSVRCISLMPMPDDLFRTGRGETDPINTNEERIAAAG